MSQFAPLIREIGAELRVPQPARSRILLEIAADLEGMFAHYRSQGLSSGEAAARARETLALSGEALDGLRRIHQPPVRRLLDLLSVQAQAAWERVTLAVLAVCVALLTVREVLTSRGSVGTSSFVWPIAGIAAVALLLGLVKIYALYLKQDHEPLRLRRGLDSLLFLAASSLGLGLLGLMVELYLTARRIIGDQEWTQPYLPEFLLRSSALMMLSLLVAIAIGVAWFVLLGTVQRIERAEAEGLMTHHGDETSAEDHHPRLSGGTATPGLSS
jgi:hypothetical protein